MKNLTTFLLLVTSIILVCYSVFLNKNDDEKSTEEHVSVVSSRENDVSKSATTDIDSVYKREVNDFEKIINDTRITSLEVKNKTMPDAIEYICNELKNDKNLALPNNFNIILCDSDVHVGNVSLNIKYQSIKSMLDTLSNEFGYTYYLKNQNIYLRIKTSTLRKLKKTSNPLNNISIDNIKIEDQPMSVVVERIQEKIAESKIKVVLADSHVHVENISFNLENVSLKEVLNLLKSKYGYLYDFKDSVINIRIDPIVARRLKENMLFREKQQKQMQFGNVETLKKKEDQIINTSEADLTFAKNIVKSSNFEFLAKKKNAIPTTKVHRKYMLNIDISQKVNRLYSGEDGSNNSTNVRKEITVTIKSFVPIDVIVCYFCNVGSDYKSEAHLKHKYYVMSVDRDNPHVFKFEDVTPAYRNYSYRNYRHTYGNAKMQSAIFLYEKETGNLIGKKGTKDNFLKYIEATKRDEMISYVKSVKEGNGNTRSNYSSSDGSPIYGHNFTTPKTSIQRIHTNSNSTIRIYNMPLKNLEKPVEIYGSYQRSEDFWIFSFFVYVSNGKVEVEKNINKLRAFYNHKYFLKDNKNFVDFGIIIYDANTKEIVYKNANRSIDITDYMDENYTKQIVEFMEHYETISSQEYKRSSSY